MSIKAYKVSTQYGEVSEIAFAESPSKAKSMALGGNWYHDAQYSDLRAVRTPDWDDMAGKYGPGLAPFENDDVRRKARLCGWYEYELGGGACVECDLYEWSDIPESELDENDLCDACRAKIKQPTGTPQ